MKKLAIISEFNPFHNGHKYLIDECKRETDADVYISFMSGDFVQRGEPAIIDKFERANVALSCGFDLVVEMPSYISLQSAEFFAYKSIEILNKLSIDYLAFGIEKIEAKTFKNYAKILIDEDKKIEDLTKEFLRKKYSFTKSRYLAIEKVLNTEDFISSNNILALEYVRAINKINPSIELIPIPRVGANNSDLFITNKTYASSTAIRNNLEGKTRNLMPEVSYSNLTNFIDVYGKVNDNSIYNIFKHKLLIDKIPLDDVLTFAEGLDDLFVKRAGTCNSYEEFLKEVTSQAYTKSRIRRLVINYILNNKNFLNDMDVNFIKVLAFNENSLKIFAGLNKSLSIIIRKSDSDKLDAKNKLVYDKMVDASNLYSLLLGRNMYQDYTKPIKLTRKKPMK